MTGRTAFLSYSHDSDLHRQRVAGLSERLRRDGFETVLDQYRADGAPPEGWGPWAMREISRASHVLCICTAAYRERFFRESADGIGRGVWFEAQQIITLLYESKSMPSKWIGAAVFSGADRAHIPPPLGRTFVLDSEESYRNLYDAMLGQTGLEPGSIGDVITRPRTTILPARFGSAPDGPALPEAAGADAGAPPSAAELRWLASFGRRYCQAVADAVQRIDIAQVDGEARTKSVPLRKLYISLVAEPTSFEERQKAREIDAEVTRQARYAPGHWLDVLLRPSESGFDRRLDADEIAGEVRQPAPPRDPGPGRVHGEPDSATAGLGEPLHDVVRRERCCVILGDPGSGKSVLCRWLAHELAECHVKGEPSAALGPARVPFLIVLRELGERSADPRPPARLDRGGSFVDLIVALARPDELVARDVDWQRFVADTLRHGSALIVLDGLDEVPHDELPDVLPRIEQFARAMTASTGNATPDSGVGHQILITSRRTGYYQNHLPPPFNHFVIRQMTDDQIRGFCHQWCDATDRAAMEATLLAEIFDARRERVHALARNPLLLSILCQLGTRDPDHAARLPAIRAELYEKVIYETADQWRKAALTSLGERYFTELLAGHDNVLALFAPLARHIHERLMSNEIGRRELQDLLVQALAWFEGKADHEVDSKQNRKRGAFLMHAVERVVGVLSERSRGRYQFLHLTFQEYLAGISLLLCDLANRVPGAPVLGLDARALVDRIVAGGYLSDTRWRQPLLLLLGQLAWMEASSRADRERIAPRLEQVIQLLDELHAAGRLGLAGEPWALFLADALAEVPEDHLLRAGAITGFLQRTIGQLLDAYGRFGPGDEVLRGRVVFAERLAAIRRRIGAEAFETALFSACQTDARDHRLAAAAHLVLARAWLSQRAIDFFFDHLDHDGPPGRWAIHRLLRQAATREPLIDVQQPPESFTAPPAEAGRALQRYRAALPEWHRLCEEYRERVRPAESLRPSAAQSQFAAIHPAAVTRLLGDAEQAMTAIAALGGFGDHDTRRRSEKHRDYKRWLQQAKVAREAQLDAEPWRHVPWFGAEDTVNRMREHSEHPSWVYRESPRMHPDRIVRSGALAIAMFRALARGDQVVEALVACARDAALGCERAELIAVARLCGCDRALQLLGPVRPDEVDRVHWHLERIQDDLLDACHRSAARLPAWLATQRARSGAEWHVVFRTLSCAWVASGAVDHAVGALAPLPSTLGAASDLGEAWGQTLAGVGDNPAYRLAALQGQWPARTSQDCQLLLRAITRSASLASCGVAVPDLIELGTGALTLPPLAFYETVIALRDFANERIGNESLARSWVAMALRVVRAHDPLSGSDVWSSPQLQRETGMAPALWDWRVLLGEHIVRPMISGFAGALRMPLPRDLAVRWLRAWDACVDVEQRLAMARDAAALALASEPAVEPRIEQLLGSLAPPWHAEGALLAACLARRCPDRAEPWLRLALHRLERTTDRDWQAEIARAIGSLVAGHSDPADRLRMQRVLDALPARHRAIADGRPACWLRSWAAANWPAEGELRQALAVSVLVALAIEERAIDHGAAGMASVAALWGALHRALEGGAPPDRIRTLVDRCIDAAGPGALTLSEPAVDTLGLLAARPDLADRTGAARLFPLLGHPAPSVVPRIRRLQDRVGRAADSEGALASLQRHLVLWLSEAERRYTADDLVPLHLLAVHGDDRSRARAQLALHGKEVWLGGRPAACSLAGLEGKRTMEQLAILCETEFDAERHLWLSGRALFEWTIDDPEVLSEWLRALSARPDDRALLRTVFLPWRWSSSCLQIWQDWIGSVRDARCLEWCARWLAVIRVARADSSHPMTAAVCPGIPDWPADLVPEISWLPGGEADRLVFSALTAACSESSEISEIVARAEQALRRDVRNLRAWRRDRPGALELAYAELGDSITQYLSEQPETAFTAIADPARLNETIVTALMHWTRRCLAQWDQDRRDASGVLETTCVSQLSLLASIFVQDLWPNAIRVAARDASRGSEATDLPAWPTLLCNVIRYFPTDRAVQAAWTLLARITRPDEALDSLWAALLCSMKDRPIVRDRALAVLFSAEGRSLVAALPAASIRSALEAWRDEQRGQTVLAMARMFAAIALKPGTDARLRREIQQLLRERASDPDSHRRLFRMQGVGGRQESQFQIVAEPFLDEELRVLELELLTQPPSEA